MNLGDTVQPITVTLSEDYVGSEMLVQVSWGNAVCPDTPPSVAPCTPMASKLSTLYSSYPYAFEYAVFSAWDTLSCHSLMGTLIYPSRASLTLSPVDHHYLYHQPCHTGHNHCHLWTASLCQAKFYWSYLILNNHLWGWFYRWRNQWPEWGSY